MKVSKVSPVKEIKVVTVAGLPVYTRWLAYRQLILHILCRKYRDDGRFLSFNASVSLDRDRRSNKF
jgi:hypothetical protein